MRCIHYITARYRGTGVGRLCNAYDSILTSRLICLCSKVLAIPPRNLRVAYRDHHIQIVRLKVKRGYDQLKTNCNASEPLTLQLYVLVQQRPLTKETLFLLKAKVLYGKTSYEDGDVLEGKPGWRPSEKQKSDVM